MTVANYVETKPNTAFGKPVVKGTRIPVDLVVGKVAGGMGVDEVAKEYGLEKPQILGALQYAATVVSQEIVFA